MLTQISAAAYACGLCIQRYALQEGEDAEPTDPPTSRPDDDGATTLYDAHRHAHAAAIHPFVVSYPFRHHDRYVRHVSSDYTTSPSTSRYGGPQESTNNAATARAHRIASRHIKSHRIARAAPRRTHRIARTARTGKGG